MKACKGVDFQKASINGLEQNFKIRITHSQHLGIYLSEGKNKKRYHLISIYFSSYLKT